MGAAFCVEPNEESMQNRCREAKSLSPVNVSQRLRSLLAFLNEANVVNEAKIGLKQKKAQFSAADPVIYGDADGGTQSRYEREDLPVNDFQKKQPSISGTRGKRITNNLINAKEESEKLKEQCAQQ